MIDVSQAFLLRDPEHLSEICHRPVRAESGFDEVWIACMGPAAVIAWNTGLVADTVGWDEIARLIDIRIGPEPLATTVGLVRRWAPQWSDTLPCKSCGDPPTPLCPVCKGTGMMAGRACIEGLAMGHMVDRDLVARCFTVLDLPDDEKVAVSWSFVPTGLLVFDGDGWRAVVGALNPAGDPDTSGLPELGACQ